MSGPPAAPVTAPRGGRVPKLLRYFTGSVVATICSEAAFVLLYGVLGVGTTWSSILSWLAGAVPNFWLNRNWAWQRKGRPGFRDEVAPYVAIIVVTVLLATLTTHLVDAWLQAQGSSHTLRVALVAIVFFGVYVVVFALRFFLLERLFASLPHPDAPADVPGTDSPTEGTR